MLAPIAVHAQMSGFPSRYGLLRSRSQRTVRPCAYGSGLGAESGGRGQNGLGGWSIG